MILAARGGLNHHLSRGDSGGTYVGYGGWGLRDEDREHNPLGLTAVAAAIRLVSGTISTFVMRPYTGDASKRQPLLDAPQAPLLQDGAEDYCTSSDLWSDTSTNIETDGFALIWKGRDGDGIVRELYPFPVQASCIYVDANGNRVVEARVNGERVDISKNVIVVRGWSPLSAVEGVSTLRLHRRTLDGMVAMQEYRGRYFDSDATPNLLLVHPGNPNVTQRKDFRESWNATHRGPDGEKMGFLWGGITPHQLSSTLEEAQIAALSGLDVMDVARMFLIYPLTLLSIGEERTLPTPEQVTLLFYRLTLMHRMKRIERAVSADREVFPDRKVYSQFDSMDFTAGDTTTIAAMVHQLKQDGVMTANEGRARIGLPPSTDPAADKLLETPVGAAPNDDPNPDGEPA